MTFSLKFSPDLVYSLLPDAIKKLGDYQIIDGNEALRILKARSRTPMKYDSLLEISIQEDLFRFAEISITILDPHPGMFEAWEMYQLYGQRYVPADYVTSGRLEHILRESCKPYDSESWLTP